MTINSYDKAIAGGVSTHPRNLYRIAASRRPSVKMHSAHTDDGSDDGIIMNETHAQSRDPAVHLVDVCRACEGFLSTAAEVAESVELRRRFRRRAANWARLEAALLDAAPIPVKFEGHAANAAGTLHRAWIKIKSALGDMDAIIAECALREAEAFQELRAAMDSGLPDSTRDVIRRFANKEPGVK